MHSYKKNPNDPELFLFIKPVENYHSDEMIVEESCDRYDFIFNNASL